MPECPVCELNFPGVLPEFCSRCAWDIKNGPLFIISLDPIPAEYLDVWRQRRDLARNLWKEREESEAKASQDEQRQQADKLEKERASQAQADREKQTLEPKKARQKSVNKGVVKWEWGEFLFFILGLPLVGICIKLTI